MYILDVYIYINNWIPPISIIIWSVRIVILRKIFKTIVYVYWKYWWLATYLTELKYSQLKVDKETFQAVTVLDSAIVNPVKFCY